MTASKLNNLTGVKFPHHQRRNTMTIYRYKNTEEILNEFGKMLPTVEIEASSQIDADETYRGYDGSRAENKMRDTHV